MFGKQKKKIEQRKQKLTIYKKIILIQSAQQQRARISILSFFQTFYYLEYDVNTKILLYNNKIQSIKKNLLFRIKN
jgi:hypothetical protein